MLNSPISWLGGKRLLRKRIIEQFPEHICYVEVFAGAAWVLFGKEPSKVEVLNDIDGDLINFYRVVQCCFSEMVLKLQWDLVSREKFEEYKNTDANQLTNVERAKNFYYLIKTSFGSTGKTFGYGTTSGPNLNLRNVEKNIKKAHDRLQKVVIENLDYLDILKRYDRKHTLFYLDPPYRTPSSKNYMVFFEDKHFVELNKALKNLKGKFILSINDDLFVRTLFKGFNFETVETTYSIQSSGSQKIKELLIKNF